MKSVQLEFNDIPQFSKFDRDYTLKPNRFNEFLSSIASPESLEKTIRNKQKTYTFDRNKLAQTIECQYDNIGILEPKTKETIQKLKEKNTYTIITAHQPSLFTGPLYFIYKIVSAIRTAQHLESHQLDINVLPVFIIGGEDHDFEEINHFYYKKNRFEWKRDFGGPVGRMKLKNIAKILNDLQPHLKKSFYGGKIFDLLKECYNEDYTLRQATQLFVHRLFYDYPLIVASMDERSLKEDFVPFIEQEVFHQISQAPIQSTQEKLNTLGYPSQAHARAINFFYIHKDKRCRVEQIENRFHIQGTNVILSASEMQREIHNHPEKFSPNVVMRPVYQEFVWPNLMYIGGGGELAYWMERKEQFNLFDVAFPMLLRRHSATIIETQDLDLLDKYDLDIKDVFENKHLVFKEKLQKVYSQELDYKTYYQQIANIFESIHREKNPHQDENFAYSISAAEVHALRTIERIEKKHLKKLKQKERTQLEVIERIQEAFLPQDKLQERQMNFIELYEKMGTRLLPALFKSFEPFQLKMMVLIDEDVK